MRIAIFGKNTENNTLDFYSRLISSMQQHHCSVLIFEPLFKILKFKVAIPKNISLFSSYSDLNKNADYLFSIGGDGTMLEAVSLVKDSGIPILGFNIGRLGFLSSISKEELDLSMSYFFNNNFSLEKRNLLKLISKDELFGNQNFALNEFTILKKDYSTMITIHVFINDVFLNTYWSDGLIISTPTGSTAYSLSCGGPIITPDSENFIITPIASHNLTVRPLVIPDNSIVKLQVEGRSDNFLITLDSKQETIGPDKELIIKKEDFFINLIQLPTKNFFSTIRDKLMWGLDKRN
jgi:NAD+ kinase